MRLHVKSKVLITICERQAKKWRFTHRGVCYIFESSFLDSFYDIIHPIRLQGDTLITSINTNISITPGLLDVAINSFKKGIKQVADDIITQLIFIIEAQNNEIKNFYTELEINPSQIASLHFDDIDDFMNKNAIQVKRLLDMLEPFKDNSDAFTQLYDSLDKLYNTLSITFIEIGFLESEYNQSLRELNAS